MTTQPVCFGIQLVPYSISCQIICPNRAEQSCLWTRPWLSMCTNDSMRPMEDIVAARTISKRNSTLECADRTHSQLGDAQLGYDPDRCQREVALSSNGAPEWTRGAGGHHAGDGNHGIIRRGLSRTHKMKFDDRNGFQLTLVCPALPDLSKPYLNMPCLSALYDIGV
eukprot:709412-Amphidinium_carterae.1